MHGPTEVQPGRRASDPCRLLNARALSVDLAPATISRATSSIGFVQAQRSTRTRRTRFTTVRAASIVHQSSAEFAGTGRRCGQAAPVLARRAPPSPVIAIAPTGAGQENESAAALLPPAAASPSTASIYTAAHAGITGPKRAAPDWPHRERFQDVPGVDQKSASGLSVHSSKSPRAPDKKRPGRTKQPSCSLKAQECRLARAASLPATTCAERSAPLNSCTQRQLDSMPDVPVRYRVHDIGDARLGKHCAVESREVN